MGQTESRSMQVKVLGLIFTAGVLKMPKDKHAYGKDHNMEACLSPHCPILYPLCPCTAPPPSQQSFASFLCPWFPPSYTAGTPTQCL